MRLSTLLAGAAALLLAAGAGAQTISVNQVVTFSSGTYTYSDTFTVAGPAGTSVTDIFLASDDLSPLNLTIAKNGAVDANWGWLGNDTPYNYLQFTSLDPSDTLGNGDKLQVTFSDSDQLNFRPLATGFATAFDATSASFTPFVRNLITPTAVPEPGAATLAVGALACGGLIVFRRRR